MAVLGFNFPPDSGEKVTLEITVLMSLTMFMNMVSSMQPPSSETPLIGRLIQWYLDFKTETFKT